MSLLPNTYNFNDHYKGSTFSGVNIKFNFDITGATIICQIKKNDTDTAFIHEWKTGVNITVIDASIGHIVLNQINKFDKPSGNYVHDLEVNFANGTNFTYMRGTLRIHQDSSRLIP